MMTPFQAGEMFLSLRLHFTRPSYDYFKYHGKTTLTPEKFALRSDKFLFAKLTRQYQDADSFRDLVVSNCLRDPHLYSRSLLTPEARDRFLAYRKIHESLSYLMEQDCQRLLETHPNLDEWVRVRQEYPILLKSVWQQQVHMETMIMINRLVNFLPMWERKITDTIKWPSFLMVWKKYDPFLSCNPARLKHFLRSSLTPTT